MKISLILECGPNGPDQLVLEHLIKERLRPDAEVRCFTLSGKENLMNECGTLTATLLNPDNRDKPDRVIIVWDRKPFWRRRAAAGRRRGTADKPTCADNFNHVREQLRVAGVPEDADVHLICIEAELEAWLLTDARAIRTVLTGYKGHDVGKVTVPRYPHRLDNPKVSLEKIFEDLKCGQYDPYADAIRLVRAMPDLSKIAKCDSFLAFRKSVLA